MEYIFEIGDIGKCGSGGNGKSDLLARAKAAEARAEKAERERDAAGHVLRIFESINDMAISLNTSTATAGLWIRHGDIRATGCKYAVCEGEEKANEAR